MRRKIVLAAVAGAAALGAGPAFAYWSVAVSATSTTASSVALSTISAPTNGNVAATVISSTEVDIKVTAAPSTGTIPTAYQVKRVSPASTVCDSIQVNAVCHDANLNAGTAYFYQVFGRVGDNWIGTSSLTVGNTTTAAPTLQAITAGAPVTSGSPATWTVTFTQPVSGVATSNFSMTGTGTASASVATVAASGGTAPSTSWTVTSTNTTGSGSVRLDLANKTSIVDSGGTGLSNTTPVTGTSVTVNASNKIHVASITASSAIQNPQHYRTTLTITVVDANANPISGVTVTGSWSPTASTAGCAATSASGQCTITTGNNDFNNGTAETWTVNNLSLANYTYDSAADAKQSITINCSSSGTCTSS
jgi:hypothetical protein